MIFRLRQGHNRGLLQLAAAVMLAAGCGMPGGARRRAHPRCPICFFSAAGGGSVEWGGGAGSPPAQAGLLTAVASYSSPRTRPAAAPPVCASRPRGVLQLAAAVMLAAGCGMPGDARRRAHPRCPICFFSAAGGGSVEWGGGAGSPPASWTAYSGSKLQQSTDPACGRATGVRVAPAWGGATPAAAPPQQWSAAACCRCDARSWLRHARRCAPTRSPALSNLLLQRGRRRER